NNKLGNNDIAYEDKPRHERPLGRSFEMLSEAFCGLELPGDGGQATPRGILGAVERHNENRGDLAAYVHKEVLGICADFARNEIERGFTEVPRNVNPNCMSHSAQIPDADGTTYLDIILPPAGDIPGPEFPDPLPHLDQTPSRDQEVLRSLIIEGK